MDRQSWKLQNESQLLKQFEGYFRNFPIPKASAAGRTQRSGSSKGGRPHRSKLRKLTEKCSRKKQKKKTEEWILRNIHPKAEQKLALNPKFGRNTYLILRFQENQNQTQKKRKRNLQHLQRIPPPISSASRRKQSQSQQESSSRLKSTDRSHALNKR